MAWLVRNGDVLAAAEIANGSRARRRGLLRRDGIEGAMVLRPCRHVHTVGMRFGLDVAFCDAEGLVLRTCSLAPWRLSPVIFRSAFVIEAEVGAFDRWRLCAGDRVELRA
ncbi:MAG: DUF192 domain-containing protein [Acidimicrobiia bacterium]